jgi:hypothetical protein
LLRVAGDYFSACSRLITDSSTGLKAHCSAGRDWAGQRQSCPQPAQPCGFGLSSPFNGITNKIRVYIIWEVLWEFSNSSPSPSHDLIWIRVILKIKCWSFLFLENNVTLLNLKRTAHSTNCLYNSFCSLIIFHLVLLFKGIIWVRCL